MILPRYDRFQNPTNGVLKEISYILKDVLKTGGVPNFIFILPRLCVKLRTFFLFMPDVEILFCVTMFGKKIQVFSV